MLNAYKIFSYPAAGDSLQKLLWAAILVVLSVLFGARPIFIAIGFLIGSCGKILTHFVGLRHKLHLLRLRLDLTSPDMKRFLVLLSPLLVGILAAWGRDLVTKGWYGSYLPVAGQLAAIDWAKRIGDFPRDVLPYALSIAMFPFLCEMANRKDHEQLGRVVTTAVKLLALFFVPVTIATFVMRRPVVQFLYQWTANWTPEATDWTSCALGCYSVGIVFLAIEPILMQSFFSMQNTWIPVSIGLVASGLQVAGLYVAVSVLGLDRFYCVALAYPVSRTLKTFLLIGVMKRRVPILPAKETVLFLVKLAVISCGIAGAMWGTDRVAAPLLRAGEAGGAVTKMLVAARLAAASLGGAAAFAVLCYLLRVEEVMLVITWLKQEGWVRVKEKFFPSRS
jgi:putative peptidoglycan lipid II flippase